MGDMYSQKLNINNPIDFLVKSSVISSSNYLHDKTREDKDRLNAKIYFALSLVLTIFASFFITSYRWIAILVLMNLLILLLISSTKNYNKQRKIFWDNRKKMKKSFKDLNLEWRD